MVDNIGHFKNTVYVSVPQFYGKHHRPSDLFANTAYLLIFQGYQQIFPYISGVPANMYLYFWGTRKYVLIFQGYQEIFTDISELSATVLLYFRGTSKYLLIF